MANSSPPADMQRQWTPVVLECAHFRNPDGTPRRLHLHYMPHRPTTNAHQQQDPTNTTAAAAADATANQPPIPAGATKVVRLNNMLSPHHRLDDDEFYQDLVLDVTEEARKFGNLVKLVIPRPGPGGDDPAVAGVGEAFLEYACLDSSARCKTRLDRRWFGGRQISAGFYPEDMFAAGDYGYD